jgi:hypothetical protein
MHAVFAEQGRVLAKLSAVQISRRSDNPTAPSRLAWHKTGCRSRSGSASGRPHRPTAGTMDIKHASARHRLKPLPRLSLNERLP